ncbi:DUF192 domain-containing protein [Candidatus Halocynthiibacter alkanivorans]|uniref:DUF192 domain-containing protein n=1 Tax=Candidatus Halocynthiibacter alkanivorans TaxID=2267619 RepID=UPI000DF1780A|nr:DUF192 domain-containing protein [Candidatus Halocynthiibacter alkanivorans]
MKAGRIALSLLLSLATGTAALAGGCRNDIVELRGDWGSARFTVEVADDNAERAQGLMNRNSLASSAGMLFIFDAPQPASFWMKNTLIPLDMIFVDESGLVREVKSNAIPGDETPIFGGNDILMVLEINGGLAGRLGITPGSEIRHPGLSPEKILWDCGEKS